MGKDKQWGVVTFVFVLMCLLTVLGAYVVIQSGRPVTRVERIGR